MGNDELARRIEQSLQGIRRTIGELERIVQLEQTKSDINSRPCPSPSNVWK
jgi:hypothetical protein